MKPTFIVAAVFIAASSTAASVRADEAVTADRPRSEDEAARHRIDRAWLYVDDATIAAPGSVVATTSVSYTRVGSNPARVDAPYKPFAFNTAQPGALMSLGGEVGVLPRVSALALGQMAAGGETGGPNAGVIAGVRFLVSPPSWGVHLVASVGYLREAWSPDQPQGDNGVWSEVAMAGEFRRLHFAMTAHGEHVFATGRDGVDLMFRAGASYRVVGAFRAGFEWVGQDLEESFKDAAEGGARQFVGPTAALQLLDDRLTLVAGPSLGLSDRSPQLLGRFALSYGF